MFEHRKKIMKELEYFLINNLFFIKFENRRKIMKEMEYILINNVFSEVNTHTNEDSEITNN